MGLKLTIKPGERFFVGASEVLVVSEHITTVIVGGTAPVLREEDYLEPSEVSTSTDELRLIVQQIYLSGSTTDLHDTYLMAFQQLWRNDPGLQGALAQINALLMQRQFYRAVKAAKALTVSPSSAATLHIVAS